MKLAPHRRRYLRQKVTTVLVAIALLFGAVWLVGATWRGLLWTPHADIETD